MMSSSSSLYELFRDRFQQLAGKVDSAFSPQQAAQLVGYLLADKGVRRVAKAKLPQEIERELVPLLRRLGIHVVEPTVRSDVVKELDQAEVGITTADFAIAETGSLVEITYDDASRLVSALPPTHIAYVFAQEILPSIDQAIQIMKNRYARLQDNQVITFISGPSRTGDVEATLVLGAHGPHEVHAIVMNWSRGT